MTAPDDTDGVGTIWTKAKTQLRNHLDYQRRRDPAWEGVELTLFLEINCVRVEDIPLLGDEKRRQYNELRHIPFDASGTVWIVTGHGLLHTGPNLSVDEVYIALTERLFPKFNQVAIKQLVDTKRVYTSISDIVNYGMKRICETTVIDGHSMMWDTDQIVDFALWQERFSRGFQSLVMKFGMRKRLVRSVKETEREEAGFIKSRMLSHTGNASERPVRRPLQYFDKYLNRNNFWVERTDMLSYTEWLKQKDQAGSPTLLLEKDTVASPTVPAPVEKLLHKDTNPAAPSTKACLLMAKPRLTMKNVFASTNNRPVRLSGGRFRTMADVFRTVEA